MKLDEYLFKNKVTCAELGRALGYNGHYMISIKNGVHRPSLKLAEQIEIYTGGQVTVKELRGKNGR